MPTSHGAAVVAVVVGAPVGVVTIVLVGVRAGEPGTVVVVVVPVLGCLAFCTLMYSLWRFRHVVLRRQQRGLVHPGPDLGHIGREQL